MLTKLKSGRIYDPAHGVNGEIRDLFVDDGRIVTDPGPDRTIDREYDLRGLIVMAGAIDLHTHIGGGKVNIARTLLPEDHRRHPAHRTALQRSGSGHAAPSTLTTGYRYAEMGYTTCMEPAVLPVNARQAHMEMADTPMVDTGGYALLGNDDFLLQMIAQGAAQSMINDYVAWTLRATQCIGIKVVNAGGINAFKFNVRSLDVDETGPHYGVRPRDIIRTLSRAVHELGVPHPLHVHASNLGVPGNYSATLATVDAADGYPLHLTHVQFHSYGTEGDLGFSSAARSITEMMDRNPNVTVDVGQILFGQTVTASGDTMRQYAMHGHAHPKKWVCMDIECDAGCGVVPFRYRNRNFVNALQWAIGLEIFLTAKDPWRVFLTTDHPNGAPFTSYPHLIRLLTDRGFRNDRLASLHPEAIRMSGLEGLEREYSLYEIAIMTRAGPARILGLEDRGHLGPGAAADITVYRPRDDHEAMFESPALVFKDGEPVVREGTLIKTVPGHTHVVRPEYDTAIEGRLERWYRDHHTIQMRNLMIGDEEMAEAIGSPVEIHPCQR